MTLITPAAGVAPAFAMSLVLAALAPALAMVPAARADVEVLQATADTTLIQSFPTGSNGAGSHMFAGVNGQASPRRALVRFDVAGSIPAGSTITSATLTLNMSMTIVEDVDFQLHRLTADWGEAGSNADGGGGGGGGSGAAGEKGDATWIFRFLPTEFWTTVGGDFDAAPSALTTVGMPTGPYTWASIGTVADAQAWLDDPASDFGWILIGDESGGITTKRFDTHDNDDPAVRPTLTVEFTPPDSCGFDINCDGQVNVQDLVEVILNWGDCPDPPADCPADTNLDGAVNVEDLVGVILNWS